MTKYVLVLTLTRQNFYQLIFIAIITTNKFRRSPNPFLKPHKRHKSSFVHKFKLFFTNRAYGQDKTYRKALKINDNLKI